MNKARPLKQWEIAAKIITRTTVIVEAEDENAALDRFNRGLFDDMGGGEMSDWEAVSRPNEVE